MNRMMKRLPVHVYATIDLEYNQLTQTMQPSWVHAGFLEPLTLTKLLPIFTSLRLAMDIVSLS